MQGPTIITISVWHLRQQRFESGLGMKGEFDRFGPLPPVYATSFPTIGSPKRGRCTHIAEWRCTHHTSMHQSRARRKNIISTIQKNEGFSPYFHLISLPDISLLRFKITGGRGRAQVHDALSSFIYDLKTLAPAQRHFHHPMRSMGPPAPSLRCRASSLSRQADTFLGPPRVGDFGRSASTNSPRRSSAQVSGG
ncbi:hypothetical protein EDB92DRAFT_1542903 [Lactarius akahatsu]|uniref:Uncharacterized protein n=1 Tax=Lactarius akahatsu TaxID=416441 RepID=A0AAD4LD65_9AGAM|nr:hypothetical protein EDB92DRAFT_1542903 [Lactarius akahatsu]